VLWSEVVRWYSLANTSGMRYLEDTKKFWKLGWRLFGGKFLNFMSGFKNQSDIVLGVSDREYYDPQSSDINFAIPSVESLRSFAPYGVDVAKPRPPGVFTDAMGKAGDALKNTSACLSFNGKK
jgi:hypothetical protein